MMVRFRGELLYCSSTISTLDGHRKASHLLEMLLPLDNSRLT